MRNLMLGALLLAVTGCTTATGGSAVAGSTAASPRPEADAARDVGRKPYGVLEFLGVEPGMTTLDVIAASGYYTEVLSGEVGVNGIVYAQNPARVLRFRQGANDLALTSRLAGNRLANVRRLDREFDDLGLVDNSVDVAITALNFHDIYNNDAQAAQQVLMVVRRVLKPGGVLGVIDHVGNAGADNAKLHRIEPSLAIAAAKAAGFSVEQSDLLSNPDDDHTQSPFAPGIRGNTDRFLLKLTKPSN